MNGNNIPPVLPLPPPAKIRYSLTRWDLFRWQLWHTVRLKVLWIIFLGATTTIVVPQLRTPELSAHSAGFKIGFTIIAAVVMLMFMFLLQLILLVFMIFAPKGRGLLGEHELEIREDGLLERTDVNESLHRWKGFHKMVSSGGYFYIYVTHNNFHIVPKCCFSSAHEAVLFRDEIMRRFKSAQVEPYPRAA